MADRRRGIIWFVAIAYTITWGCILAIVLLKLPIPEATQDISNPLLAVLSTIATFGPAIAAFIVLKWITREGFKNVGLRLNLKAGWKYYLAAAFFPLVVIPVAVGVAAAAGEAVSGLSVLTLEAIIPLLAASAIATLLFFGEEFGWRGYLQVRIAPGQPLLAAILTGLIWGVYHFPFVILGFSFSGNPIALLIYPIDCILGSIFLGWLRTKGDSVWPACLAHSVGNQFITPVIALLLPGTSFMLAWGAYTLAGYAVLALALILTRQVPWRDRLATS